MERIQRSTPESEHIYKLNSDSSLSTGSTGNIGFQAEIGVIAKSLKNPSNSPPLFTIHQLMPYSGFIGLVWNVMRLPAQSDLKFLTDEDDTLFIAASR